MRITNEQRVTAIHEYHAALGRNGGAAKSPAKTAAARRNIAVRWARRRAAGAVPVGQPAPEAPAAGLAVPVAPPEAGGRADTTARRLDEMSAPEIRAWYSALSSEAQLRALESPRGPFIGAAMATETNTQDGIAGTWTTPESGE